MRRVVPALLLAVASVGQGVRAEPYLAQASAAAAPLTPAVVLQRLRQSQAASAPSLTERQIVDALQSAPLTASEARDLWTSFANGDSSKFVTLPVVLALVRASTTVEAREAMWSELAGLALAFSSRTRAKGHSREASLLGIFEAHRKTILPLLTGSRETQDAGDDMTGLMLKSRVFGDDVDDSAIVVARRAPAAVARYIERERGLGRRDKWEHAAFESMNAWKAANLLPGAVEAPHTLADLDAAGVTFVTMFNCLHWLDDGYREVLLRGLGPVEVFNAVVGGEKELYRLGTSSYREFLHASIMTGIRRAGSFEAFLEQATPRRFGEQAHKSISHRAMVFLRVASAFGVLDDVLVTVADRERFVADTITSLEDARSFEENSVVTLDVLTAKPDSETADSFKRLLLERLYARYSSEQRGDLRSVFGSLLSVYQSMTGDHRVPEIDTAFAVDNVAFEIPFDRLFSRDAGQLVHRMFMRMDSSGHDEATYEAFRVLMKKLGAKVEAERFYDVFRIGAAGRRIEIYANTPSHVGVSQGISNIAAALNGKRIETIIGRGHTTIIAPLQADAKKIAGAQIKDVALVMLGTCGGDASVRSMISTFGYVPFIASRSTGRQQINEAVIKNYIVALQALPPNASLPIVRVLDDALARYTKKDAEPSLRDDAGHYRVSRATVLTARLFDSYVRRHIGVSLAGTE